MYLEISKHVSYFLLIYYAIMSASDINIISLTPPKLNPNLPVGKYFLHAALPNHLLAGQPVL